MKTSRIAALAIVAPLVLGLSGCTGGLDADVAATVGDTTISRADVDLLSKVICKDRVAAVKQGGASAAAYAQVEANAVNVLVETERTARFAEELGAPFDEAELRTRMASIAPLLKGLDEDDADDVRRMVREIQISDLQLQAIGAQVLQQQGAENPDGQAQANAGYNLRKQQFDDQVQVEVAPDYAPNQAGEAGKGNESLSTPVSSFAKQGVLAQPEPAWAAGLPADQKCG